MNQCLPEKCPQCGLPIRQCRCANLDVDRLARHLFARECDALSFDAFPFDVVLPYYARAASIIALPGSMQ
jgi:hypothetical protein